jgi:RiboL-PSP-HEPN
MPLGASREESSARFNEAQVLLSMIKSDDTADRRAATFSTNTQKGLFIVLLYGAFEFSINRMITSTAQIINSQRICSKHIAQPLYALALDPELRSIRDSGKNTRWPRRCDLFSKQLSDEPTLLHESDLLAETQNIRADTLAIVFRVFGIIDPHLYDLSIRQFIDELVENRNAVSHGRESAGIVGQAFTVQDLQVRFEIVAKQVSYMFAVFEQLVHSRQFISEDFRPSYPSVAVS